MDEATVLVVPGLRDEVPGHWQSLLAAQLPRVHCVPAMGRGDLDCLRRVAAIERAAQSITGPIIIVAHSGGCVTVAHWARLSARAVQGALLATPPDFDRPLPEGYPTLQALGQGGWLPMPRERLPFPAIVAASRNDPLAAFGRVAALASDWGARLVDIGAVGHLNPDSGHGPWPRAEAFVAELSTPLIKT